jgi:hypothetical protein
VGSLGASRYSIYRPRAGNPVKWTPAKSTASVVVHHVRIAVLVAHSLRCSRRDRQQELLFRPVQPQVVVQQIVEDTSERPCAGPTRGRREDQVLGNVTASATSIR